MSRLLVAATAAALLSAAAVAAPAATPPKPQAAAPKLSAAEIIERSAALTRRDQALVALYENAVSRDPSGAVKQEHAQALAERRRCADVACVTRWFNAREASLSQWQ